MPLPLAAYQRGTEALPLRSERNHIDEVHTALACNTRLESVPSPKLSSASFVRSAASRARPPWAIHPARDEEVGLVRSRVGALRPTRPLPSGLMWGSRRIPVQGDPFRLAPSLVDHQRSNSRGSAAPASSYRNRFPSGETSGRNWRRRSRELPRAGAVGS